MLVEVSNAGVITGTMPFVTAGKRPAESERPTRMRQRKRIATMAVGMTVVSWMGTSTAVAVPDFSAERDAQFLALLKSKDVTPTNFEDAVWAAFNSCLMYEDGDGVVAAAAYVHDAFQYATRESYMIAWSAAQVYCPSTN